MIWYIIFIYITVGDETYGSEAHKLFSNTNSTSSDTGTDSTSTSTDDEDFSAERMMLHAHAFR